MTDLGVSIVAEALRVAPGSQISFVVEVHNLGSVVDRYTCEVVGMPADWWTVTPGAIELFPERDLPADGRARTDAPPTSGRFTVVLRPPRTPAARAGEWPIGAKVQSEHDTADRAVEEATVTMLPFGALEADLLPSQLDGRIRASTTLSVRNAGNRPESFTASASDKARFLGYGFEPPAVTLDGGADQPVRFRVKPSKLQWLGQPVTRPFLVVVSGDGPDTAPVTLNGTLQQHPLVPPWAPRLLVYVIAFSMAAFALWAAFFKPQVDQAIQGAVGPVASQVAAIQSALPSSGAGGVASLSPTPEPSPSAAGPSSSAAPSQAPPSIPVGASSAPQAYTATIGSTDGIDSQPFAVPAGNVFTLTDIFLDNTGGDGGIVQLLRGKEVLFSWNAADFRTLDDHFVTGVRVAANQGLTITWDCQVSPQASSGGGVQACRTSVLLSGTLAKTK